MSGVVVLNQLSSRVVDAGGRSVAVPDGYSITSDNLSFLVAGTDGTNAQFLKTSSDGSLHTYSTKDGYGVLDTGNSTTSTLGAGAVFTGAAFDLLNFNTTTISVRASHASATDGLSFQWSPNGTNWDITSPSSVGADEGRGFHIAKRGRYFRVVYTNGSTIQTFFRLSVHHNAGGTGLITRPLDTTIDDDNYATITRSVLSAKRTDGNYGNIRSNNNDRLLVASDSVNTDDGAFTAGSGSLTVMGGFATTDAVDSGDVGALAMDVNRNLKVIAQSNSGVDIGDVTVNNASGASAVNIQDGGNSITVDNSGTFAVQAAQSGAWNITNISGTVSLPTGAATAANQTTANSSLATLAGAVSGTEVQVDVLTLPTVTIQDGGNTITVDGAVAATQSGTWTNRTQDGYGVPLTALASAPVGTETALLVRNIPSGVQSVTVSGTTNIAKAEDAAFADGDVGVMTLAVRRDTASSTSGTDGDFQPLITNSTGHLWVDASGQTLTAAGNVAHDSADSGNPVKIGAVARTTNPTAVSDADRVNFIADDIGRQVIVSGQVRDLITHQHTQIASSSAETTILTAAGAGVFLDLVQLVMTNQTATAVNVTIRDATAGTTRMIIALPASGGAVIPFTRPIPQSTANNAWTAQLSSAAVTVNIFAMAERNV